MSFWFNNTPTIYTLRKAAKNGETSPLKFLLPSYTHTGIDASAAYFVVPSRVCFGRNLFLAEKKNMWGILGSVGIMSRLVESLDILGVWLEKSWVKFVGWVLRIMFGVHHLVRCSRTLFSAKLKVKCLRLLPCREKSCECLSTCGLIFFSSCYLGHDLFFPFDLESDFDQWYDW